MYSVHLLGMEAPYEQLVVKSELGKLLVHLCVRAEKERLEPSPIAPQDMLRDLVSEFQRKYDPAQ